MGRCTYSGCLGADDGTSCRHPAGCAGCEWGRAIGEHRHNAAEDGPRAGCCAHTCGRSTVIGRRTVRYVRHCGACDAFVWAYRGALYTTPEAAGGVQDK